MRGYLEILRHLYKELVHKIGNRLPENLFKRKQGKELKVNTDNKKLSKFYRDKVVRRHYIKKDKLRSFIQLYQQQYK